jgi:hypothetical protein
MVKFCLEYEYFISQELAGMSMLRQQCTATACFDFYTHVEQLKTHHNLALALYGFASIMLLYPYSTTRHTQLVATNSMPVQSAATSTVQVAAASWLAAPITAQHLIAG